MEYNTRDEMLAQSVMNLYELGKFEKELTMYGCAYQEEDGEIIYVMGTDLTKVYEWKYDIANLTKRATTVHRTSIRTLLPTGMEEIISEELQKKMAMDLYNRYPLEYFEHIKTINNRVADNKSYELLKEIQYQLDGVGTIEQLDLYQGLINTAYLNKRLTEKSYYDFCRWVSVEKEDINDDLHKTDLYEKEFYGFAYAYGDEKFNVVVDGCKSQVYSLMEEKMTDGALVSPVIYKKYWYNNRYRLNDAKKDCRIFYEELFSETYRNAFLKLDKIIKNKEQTK